MFDFKMADRQCFRKKWWATVLKILNSSPSLCHLLIKNYRVTLFSFFQIWINERKPSHICSFGLIFCFKVVLFFQMNFISSLPMFLVTFLARKPWACELALYFCFRSMLEGLLIEFDLNSYPDKSDRTGLELMLFYIFDWLWFYSMGNSTSSTSKSSPSLIGFIR